MITLHRVLQAIALSSLLLTGGTCAGEKDDAGVALQHPPFLISGTVIAPATKIALIVILDEQGRALQALRLHEGETVNGYQVAQIREEHVLFERDGHTFLVRVGNDRQGRATDVVVPVARKREIAGEFVPPPNNIEEIKKQTDLVIERLKGNPGVPKGTGAA